MCTSSGVQIYRVTEPQERTYWLRWLVIFQPPRYHCDNCSLNNMRSHSPPQTWFLLEQTSTLSSVNCCSLVLLLSLAVSILTLISKTGGSRIYKRGPKDKALQAPRGHDVERKCSPPHWGSGNTPSPDFFFDFGSQNGDVGCILGTLQFSYLVEIQNVVSRVKSTSKSY